MRHDFRSARARLVLEEQLATVDEFERILAKQHAIPDRRRLVHHRLRILFQVLGALVLALNVSVLTLLGVFFVCNKILHASLLGGP